MQDLHSLVIRLESQVSVHEKSNFQYKNNVNVLTIIFK